MNILSLIALLLVSSNLLGAGIPKILVNPHADYAKGPKPNFKQTPAELSQKYLERYSTTELSHKNSEIIFNNDRSFQAKLEVIQHAVDRYNNTGKSELYLNYYIFNSDESSSYFASKLVEAAKLGVKVYITLDILQAYPRLDFYRWMESQSAGNMEFYFYGRPTKKIMLDSVHLASACVKDGKNLLKEGKTLNACTSHKKKYVSKNIDIDQFNARDPKYALPSLLLSGLYAKNPKLMAKAVLDGNQVTLEDLMGDGSSSMDDETKESLKEFLKLLLESKTSSGLDKLMAVIKLRMALKIHGQELQPLYNLITGIMPMSVILDSEGKSNKKNARDWAYFTDYTHHKLILSNDELLVMGGRNIENSYHMGPNKFSAKYIFMDTDIQVSLDAPNKDLSESQKKIHEFKALSIGMDELLTIMPNDVAGAISVSGELCAKLMEGVAVEECVQESIARLSRNADERLSYVGKKVTDAANAYASQYVAKPFTDSYQVDPGADLYYLENLHFDRKENSQKRIFGVKERYRHKASVGKEINELWIRGMEALCREKDEKTIYLYNAYFLPAGNFIKSLNKMIDGTYDCANVKLNIVTNSIETTDLGVINVFARHWLKELSKYYLNYRDSKRGAEIRYFEYDKDELVSGLAGSSLSLHSKVTVLGDDQLIVGSANADVRSYARDTNNAVYITNAPKATARVVDFIESKIDKGVITEIPVRALNLPKEELKMVNYQTLQYMNYGRCFKKGEKPGSGCEYLGPERFESAFNIFQDLLFDLEKMVRKYNLSEKTYTDVKGLYFHYSENPKQKIRWRVNGIQRKWINKYDFAFGVL